MTESQRQVAEHGEALKQLDPDLRDNLESATQRVAVLETTVSELRQQAIQPQGTTPRPGTYAFLLAAALVFAITALVVSVWALG